MRKNKKESQFLKKAVLTTEITMAFECCLTVYLPREIKRNANLMELGTFIDVFLSRHVSGTNAHHQEH